MSGHTDEERERLAKAGLHIPAPADRLPPTEEEPETAEEHRLTVEQVRFARRTGVDLARYAVMRGVRHIEDFAAAREAVRKRREAASTTGF